MNLTPEQSLIHDHVVAPLSDTNKLTLVSAVAGSGKTTLLVAIAATLSRQERNFSGLYLAYNKSVATEAQRKFPASVNCCTTHSLAYAPTVVGLKLKFGVFNYKSITEPISYDHKVYLLACIREFCLSSYLDFETFSKDNDIPDDIVQLATKYMSKMHDKKIECSHEFYLKLFHIMLASGDITYAPFDLIMLDEAGDLNEVTLEIFKLLPAVKKIMVGDPYQNIYSFNHTINCFEVMKSHGTSLPMTQSFRVNIDIAKRIERFCRHYLDPSMSFQGVEATNKTIKTRAYIARTNAALIGKMIELNQLGVQYGLTRTPAQIFEQPLSLCNLKYQGFIPDPHFRTFQEDINDYFESNELRSMYRTPLMYLKDEYPNDVALQQTIKLITRYGTKNIINCYEDARKHAKTSQSYTLGTAHSTKGLEFDEVTIAEDLNTALENIVQDLSSEITAEYLPEAVRTELNLYYVACSRAKKSLINADYLDVTLRDLIATRFKYMSNDFLEREATNPNQ